ncbi:MAG: energy transducer TonB, partial [Pseudomonadota bacterium]
MNRDPKQQLNPWLVSALIHGLPGLVFAAVYYASSFSIGKSAPDKVVSFEMIRTPPKPQKITEIQSSAQKPSEPEPEKPAKRVFGVRRDSLTAESEDTETVKQGNTLQKEDEGEVLEEEDPTTLPVPEKEFLITQMPSVLKKAKIRYPPRAREMGLEGAVIFNLLIDDQGKVRQAELVEGLIEEMNTEAK